MMEYAELVAATNFSFLHGASHPHEMVEQAKALGLSAIGICDRNSLAGVVRAHVAAKECDLKLLVGARLVTKCGFEVAAYPKDRAAYGRLSRMLTDANLEAEKGGCALTLDRIIASSKGLACILLPPVVADAAWADAARAFRRATDADVYTALVRRFDGRDGERLHFLSGAGLAMSAPPVAAIDALYHAPGRRALQDVITCIRERARITEAGYRLAANAERHLKPPEEITRLFADYPDAVFRAHEVARSVDFSLDELVYEYPDEVIGENETPMETLRRLTREGTARRWSGAPPEKIRKQIDHELQLIEELDYAPYFLTVYDIVRFARSEGIICQGRGSAANSAVCFAIGVTEVDPARIDLLFERFVSAERGEPPDIDVDFEHERREEVIQYIYEKYGRRRAAMTAVVHSYRSRGAIREVGKVFGLSEDAVSALARSTSTWTPMELTPEIIRSELGIDPSSPAVAATIALARALIGFPRHLSQHPGGFVMTCGRLDEIVPVRNAAMPDRTVIEWDKDDIDALGIMKVDVLGIGMLTCVAKALDLLSTEYDRPLTMADIPAEDPRVYDMICRADTVGVFQIESRAQMTMLPRLKPRNFYDLVIEVAIVRPGPIQGDMVHPYLRRREGLETVEYPSRELEEVLGKTLGVPLFQEQAMRIAIVAAGFSPAEADRLRRSMAAFRRAGTIREMGEKLVAGMIANGYEPDFAERCFRQLEGFGEYGFPESHAASFALVVYVSCWLKQHYPDVFLAAILNAQPLGFYAPAQLVRDAREHGVEVRPPDVNHSHWDCTLEPNPVARMTEEGGGARAVRLGFRQIKGAREPLAARVIAAREADGPFLSVDDLARRAGLSRAETDRLAEADAFRSLRVDRRRAGWASRALAAGSLPLFERAADPALAEGAGALPEMPEREHVMRDYATLRLSLKEHPLSFLREELRRRNYVPAETLLGTAQDARLALAGLVLVRQRPGTASGVIFATLEDETGIANIIIWPRAYKRFRRIVIGAKLMGVIGRVQREGQVIHVVADRLVDHTAMLDAIMDGDSFSEPLARADEVRRPSADPRGLKPHRAGRGLVMPPSRDFH